MAKLGLCLILSVGLAIGILFAVDPSLDLEVARFVQAQKSAGSLRWAEPAIAAIRDFNLYLIVALVSLSAVCIVLQVRRRGAALPPVRACVLVLLAIAIGPGLIVNAVLKENWSRPRPGVVLASADDSSFRAWWDPTGNCKRNCSFASGEASAAFVTIAVAVVAPLAMRYTAITLALLYGIMISAIRVAAGGHFVSDVIFAGVISALIVWALHGLIYRWPATRVSEEGMRALLERTPRRVLDNSVALLRTARRAAFRSTMQRPAVPDRDGPEQAAQVRAAS
ncbi:MAG: phosphatase PAP2 family protein [Pseudorhodoplanes sp.]